MRISLVVLAWAVLEIAVMIAVGQAIGVLPTILLLALGSIVGVVLLRREGARTLSAFAESVQTRRIPRQEMADGVLIAAAGVLVLVPGFVSDVLGLTLLVPTSRAIVRRQLWRRAQRHTPPHSQGGTFVVDAEVVQPDGADHRDDGASRRAERPPIVLPSERRDPHPG